MCCRKQRERHCDAGVIKLTPPSATNPVKMMKRRINILKTPRAFCSLMPHFGTREWTSSANVMTPSPMARYNSVSAQTVMEHRTRLVPLRNLLAGGAEDHLTRKDRVAAGPSEQRGVGGVDAGDEEQRAAEEVLEVVLLAAGARQRSAPLRVDGRCTR